jgi:hypothetical protein
MENSSLGSNRLGGTTKLTKDTKAQARKEGKVGFGLGSEPTANSGFRPDL